MFFIHSSYVFFKENRNLILILSLLVIESSFCIHSTFSMATEFKLERYQGKWYEIARFKNPFQKKCFKNVTAEYQLLDNGMINVVNKCEIKNDERDIVTGLARIQDENDHSKLEVSFFDIFGWRPIWGDYWVLYVDPIYSWSVVGDRKRQYGWILSRNPTLSSSNLDKAKLILDKNGYDSTALLITSNDDEN